MSLVPPTAHAIYDEKMKSHMDTYALVECLRVHGLEPKYPDGSHERCAQLLGYVVHGQSRDRLEFGAVGPIS